MIQNVGGKLVGITLDPTGQRIRMSRGCPIFAFFAKVGPISVFLRVNLNIRTHSQYSNSNRV